MIFFRDLVPEQLPYDTYIIDVDGTLVADGGRDLGALEALVLHKLRERGVVRLISNKHGERVVAIAEASGTEYIAAAHKKPSKKALGPVELQGRVVVIGDKWLTDGLFARAIGADFIKANHMRGQHDSLFVRFSYFIDDGLWFLITNLRLFLKSKAGAFFRLMRPIQWAKNGLIGAPLFFAGSLFTPALGSVLLAFAAFSLIASAGYCVNDALDAEEDRVHTKKKFRPVASGEISTFEAWWFAGFLALIALALGALVPLIVPFLVLYALLQLLYSRVLKHIPILEMLCVASFFIIRILLGGAAAGVAVSNWLVITTFALALFITAGKRYSESQGITMRSVVRSYPKEFLAVLPALTASLAIVSYALYTVLGSSNPLVVYSNAFAVFGVLWYLRDIYKADAEHPELRLFSNPGIFFSIILWVVFLLFVLYH